MSSHRCKDYYVDCDDGTRDKVCAVCGMKAKQAIAFFPLTNDLSASLTPTITAPKLRDTVTIHMDGDIDVYRDRLVEELNKAFRINLGSG